jgi:hypothetical protein
LNNTTVLETGGLVAAVEERRALRP